MRRIAKYTMFLSLACVPVAGSLAANASALPQYQNQGAYDQGGYDSEDYSPDQLDNLLAPIALYPDPLLAQVLVAATFPDQIEDASVWVQRYGPTDRSLDDQPWDVSVKAVAHYPAVINMMADMLDWTTSVGQAYVNQSTDTIASIQNLRSLARAEGNLVSTPQQQVIYNGGYIEIVPAQPQYIFVPTYDPRVIYSRRVYSNNGFGGFLSFGSGFAIGSWLNYDLDWGSRRVVYDGWNNGGVVWRQRSRPFVQINNTYVNNRYRDVPVNRSVLSRPVNNQKVNTFNSVHNNVRFDARRGGQPGGRPDQGNNNDANRGQRTVQPQAPRQNDGFNRGGQPQGQAPVQDQRRNDGSNRGGQPQAQPVPSQQPAPRGGQVQTQPPPQQQPPPVTERNSSKQDYNGANRQRGGGQNPDNLRGRAQDQQPQARPIPPAPPPSQQQRPVQEQRQAAPPPPPPPPPAQQQRPVQDQRPVQEQRQAAPAPPPPPAAAPPRAPAQQAAPAQGQGRGQERGQQGNGKENRGNRDGKDNKDNKQ